jgi:hypothetical protein
MGYSRSPRLTGKKRAARRFLWGKRDGVDTHRPGGCIKEQKARSQYQKNTVASRETHPSPRGVLLKLVIARRKVCRIPEGPLLLEREGGLLFAPQTPGKDAYSSVFSIDKGTFSS